MNRKTLFWLLLILAVIFLCIYIGTAAYQCGYMQCAIDNNSAEFSAPASIAWLSNIPYAAIAAILFIIAEFICRKNKKQ